jgi:hypothetical protein
MRFWLLLGTLAAAAGGCRTLKPYEKEYLLDKTMDDESVTALTPDVMTSAAGSFEKLGGGPAGGGATSCPTCGG